MEREPKTNRIVLIVLIILNGIVLLGQVWPEGAPPFARIVNIIFLIFSMVFFLSFFRKKNKSED
ncbi:MAG: hypothetical protein K9H64_17420 [Bacteroidales bacterium]|nr:hypothetical protein [Bacteroidales bacterium]MCF8457740.1 hypothetical protein [Bacteroidales bacterium]